MLQPRKENVLNPTLGHFLRAGTHSPQIIHLVRWPWHLRRTSLARMTDEDFAAFDVNFLIIVQRFELAVHDLVELLRGIDANNFLERRNHVGAFRHAMARAVDRDADLLFVVVAVFCKVFSLHSVFRFHKRSLLGTSLLWEAMLCMSSIFSASKHKLC